MCRTSIIRSENELLVCSHGLSGTSTKRKCPECGLVMDRDENSAVNILTRYLARLGPHTPDEECGVLQEDGLDVASMGLAQVG